ncbi:MAG: sugar transferase [Hormoscilla sp.]
MAFMALDGASVSLSWKMAKVAVEKVDWFKSVKSFHLLVSTPGQPGFLLPILVMTLGTVAAAGLYGDRSSRRQFGRLIESLTLAQILLVLIAFLYQPGLIVSRSTFLLAWLFSLIFVLTGRLVVEAIITSLRHQGRVTRKIILVGRPQDTEKGELILRLVSKKEFEIFAHVDLSSPEGRDHWPETLEQIYNQGVGEVFVCSWQAIGDPMELYWSLKACGILLRILPIGLEIPNQNPKIEIIGGMPTIIFSPPALVGSDFWLKRIFDLSVAGLILILGCPLYLLIAITIKLDSPGPIFYKQTRVGLKGRHFKVWKFRTMVVNADQLMKELEAKNEVKGGVLFKMKEDPRITKVGKFLRSYSLDELPQVINVIVGQMSLVGPRPLPLRDVEGFSEHHFLRHNVLPGITGLWQVSGRSDIQDFEDAFKLDMTYINNWSLALDFQILLRTVKVVLGKEGAY